MHEIVYLDGHSTSPLAPEAEIAMAYWWHQRAANSSSPHRRGIEAATAVEDARREIANLIGVGAEELFFTSGATEANNLALIGVANAAKNKGHCRKEIIISAIEHKSVLLSATSLERFGFKVHICPVQSDGRLNLIAFSDLLSTKTLLVSVMSANNETGAIQPISETVQLARKVGALIHVDAVQTVGKLAIDLSDFDYASFSSHKMYGPMGIGALFVSAAATIRPEPLVYGGNQESGLRPGTIPTPLVVGFGKAAQLAAEKLVENAAHSKQLADSLVNGLQSRQVAFKRTVDQSHQLPGSLSLRFAGVNATELIGDLSNSVCLSDGSACTSGQIEPSHVLSAMGLSQSEMSETVRIYCGRYNNSAEIDHAAMAIADSVSRILLRTGHTHQ